jgi:predicted metal-dependent phosphoesterase TrpH
LTRLPLAAGFALLFALGVVAGSALDATPPRAPTVRGGYRLLEADFHAHTRFSDGFLSPFDLVIQARRRGLDALAITEHNLIFPARMGRWFSRVTGGPAILIGEEVTTDTYHLHGIGLTERIHAGDPLPQVIDEIHRQGGVAIAAHPVKGYWPAFTSVIDRLDATEVMHPLAYGTGGARLRWESIRNFYEQSAASGHRLTAIGSSDYHFGSPLGICRTLVFAEGDDADAVLDALKHGRTVVFDREGKAYGDPALIEVLRQEPYTPRSQDYAYRGAGLFDRTARAIGWVGLLGLILVQRRRSPRAPAA